MLKEKDKSRRGLLVFTVICFTLIILDVILTGFINLSGEGSIPFYYIINTGMRLITFFLLILYFLKDNFKKENILYVFLFVNTFFVILNEISAFQSIIRAIKEVPEAVSYLPIYILIYILNCMPYILTLICLYKTNKKVEYATLIFFILYLLTLFLVIASEFVVLANGYDVVSYIVTIFLGGFLYFHLFLLWYSQIAKHISFKKKVKDGVVNHIEVTEVSLEELKLMFDNGEIAEEEYVRRKAEIINNI